MSRARDLSKLANPEVFSVDSINNVGVNTLTPGVKFDVIGDVSATSFNGDGSQLTGIPGVILSESNGTQRLVVTSQTTGSMTQAATNSDITYDTGTAVLSATKFSGTLLGNSTGLQGTPDIDVRNVTGVAATFTGQIKSTNVAFGFNSSAESFPFTSDSNLGNGAKAFYAKHTGSGQSNNYYFYGENSGGETFSVTTSGVLTAAGTIFSGAIVDNGATSLEGSLMGAGSVFIQKTTGNNSSALNVYQGANTTPTFGVKGDGSITAASANFSGGTSGQGDAPGIEVYKNTSEVGKPPLFVNQGNTSGYLITGRNGFTGVNTFTVDVNGSITAGVRDTSSTTATGIDINSTGSLYVQGNASTSDSATVLQYSRGTDAASFKVTADGTVTAAGNVTAYSDITLKENIETIPNALDKVLNLRGVEFDRIDKKDNPHEIGVIAQEVEKVIPEVVITNENGIKSVAYGNLVGLLIESIKELKSEIEDLKSQKED